jgi:death-on-curing protein
VIDAICGLSGIIDLGILATDLAVVQPLWHYAPELPSLPDLSAGLAMDWRKNHGFVDGNKRTAFITSYTFLAMNVIVIQASQKSVVEAIETPANSTDELGQVQTCFVEWLSTLSEEAAQKSL